jgi:hypothetical protein
MDKNDADFIHQLFRENNELRSKINTLNRDLFSKDTVIEGMDEEIREMQDKMDSGDVENEDASHVSDLVFSGCFNYSLNKLRGDLRKLQDVQLAGARE